MAKGIEQREEAGSGGLRFLRFIFLSQRPRMVALRITVIYAVIGGLWILLSDELVNVFFSDPETITQAQTVKGWIYVVLTGLVIYILMRNSLYRQLQIAEQKKVEEELQKVSSQYRRLIDFLPDPVFIHKNGEILLANMAGAKLLCVDSPVKLLGHSIVDYVHPDFLSEIKSRILKVEADGKPVPVQEGKLIRADGVTIEVEMTGIKFMFGEKSTVLSVVHDITHRKSMDDALRKSRKRYYDLIQFLPDAIFIHDEEAIVYANRAAAYLVGESTSEALVGSHITDLALPERRKELKEQFLEIFSSKRSTALVEDKILHKTGKQVDVDIKAAPFLSEDKQVFIFILRDISRQKKAEKERAHFFDLSIDMFSICSLDGYLYEINPAWNKTLGFTKEELRSKSFLEFVHPEDRESTVRETERVSQGNMMIDFQNRLLCKDGSYKWLSWNSLPHIEQELVYSVARDISKHKEAEELNRLLSETLKYDQIKTEFFANISHELRTPLNVLLGSLQLFELMMREDVRCHSQSSEKYIRIMKQNCYRLLRLVNNLIDITRVDADFFEVHPRNLDIINMVEDVCMSVAEYAKAKGIQFVFDTDVEERTMAFDPDAIERIMLNLLSNAMKFTPRGGSIEVFMQDKGEYMEISVKDTGVGIPKGKQSIIFDRFSQVDRSLTRSSEGSGIGLSLVKSLVELHGGSVDVNSEVGQGTEFIVKLPAAEMTQEDNPQEKSSSVQNRVEKIHIEFSDIYL